MTLSSTPVSFQTCYTRGGLQMPDVRLTEPIDLRALRRVPLPGGSQRLPRSDP
jgi:hypothetical protein